MSARSRIALASLGVLAWSAFAISAAAQSVAGQWEGTVVVDGMTIPFRIDISGKGEKLQGAFINGDERVTSTSGRQLRDAVRLNFDQYAEKLNAGLEGGELKGTIEGKFDPGPPSSSAFSGEAIRSSAGTARGQRSFDRRPLGN